MRGFFFTIVIISLAVTMLLALSIQQQLQTSQLPFLFAGKVVYAWEDISEDLNSATGINATKVDNTLDIMDELPAQRNFTDSINTYVSFVRRFYNSSDLSVGFYSQNGQQLVDFACFGKKQCSDNNIQFHVMPFNMTYTYPDWNKRQLDVVCYQSAQDGFPACDFSAVRSVNISINLTAINFSCNPSVFNDCDHDDIEWDNDFDDVFGCTSGLGCINYTLSIRDNNSHVYRCQGVYGDNTGNHKRVNCNEGTLNWHHSKEAKLTIKASPCHVNFEFGKDGRFRIEGKDQNEQNNCNVNMTTDILFNFNTSSFWTDFSTEMLIRDELANYSVRSPVR